MEDSQKEEDLLLFTNSEKYLTKNEAAKREYFFKPIDGYNYLKSSGII